MSLWSFVTCIPSLALLSFHQLCGRQRLFGQCVCIHCFGWSLVPIFINETQVSSPVTRTMWWRCSLSFSWFHSKKVKAKANLCILCAPVSNFRTRVKFVEIHTKALKLWTAVFHNSEGGQHFMNKIITHYRWPAGHFALHSEHLFAHLWILYATVLQFLHSLHFGRK
jgi:hypothetical protein